MKKQISMLQCVLTVIFVTALLLSNITVVKQVALPFNIEVSGGFFVFPITYILSDIFSEVYGYKWSRITSYIAFALNVFMAMVFGLLILAPGTQYFTQQAALEAILGNTPRILIASLTAFVLGDLANDKVFAKMKAKHKDHKGFTARAILSSAVGGVLDTCIFTVVAFLGQLPIMSVLIISLSETLLKLVYEILIMPVTRFVLRKVSEYENNLKES